jgi:hypothetical protein
MALALAGLHKRARRRANKRAARAKPKDQERTMTTDKRNLTFATLMLPFAMLLGVGCGDLPTTGDDLTSEQTALAATGGDFPGSKCIRNNKDGSSTSGKCEDVCKDKTVYSPHPSEDPPGTTGICYEAMKRLGTGLGTNLGSVSATAQFKTAL